MFRCAQLEPGRGAPPHKSSQVSAVGSRSHRSPASSQSQHTSTLLGRHVNNPPGASNKLFCQLPEIRTDVIRVITYVVRGKVVFSVVFTCLSTDGPYPMMHLGRQEKGPPSGRKDLRVPQGRTRQEEPDRKCRSMRGRHGHPREGETYGFTEFSTKTRESVKRNCPKQRFLLDLPIVKVGHGSIMAEIIHGVQYLVVMI